jgi:hypothetical protein
MILALYRKYLSQFMSPLKPSPVGYSRFLNQRATQGTTDDAVSLEI